VTDFPASAPHLRRDSSRGKRHDHHQRGRMVRQRWRCEQGVPRAGLPVGAGPHGARGPGYLR
jgi:hypothetical protein